MKTWQLIVGSLVMSLALAGGGYWLGTMNGPERVITETKQVVRTVTVRDTNAEQQVRRLTDLFATLKSHTHTVRTVATHADGSKVATTTRDVDVERATAVKTDTAAHLIVDSHVKTDAVEEHESKRVEVSKPGWRVGALVGLDVRTVLNGPLAPALGAHLEGRVAKSPVSVGLWGLSSGQGGASVSVEF